MLSSRERLLDIKVHNFTQMRDDNRRQFHSDLVSASSEFIEKQVKDYTEVLANIARAMSGGR